MTEATESQGESTFSFGVEHKLRDQDLLISKLLREKSPSDITNGITYQCYSLISTLLEEPIMEAATELQEQQQPDKGTH